MPIALGAVFEDGVPVHQHASDIEQTLHILQQGVLPLGTCMVGYAIIYQPTPSLASLRTIAVGAAVYHLPRKGKNAAVEIS